MLSRPNLLGHTSDHAFLHRFLVDRLQNASVFRCVARIRPRFVDSTSSEDCLDRAKFFPNRSGWSMFRQYLRIFMRVRR